MKGGHSLHYNNFNNVLEINALTCEKREEIIDTFKNRFMTYGYRQIRTPVFEPYDLYSIVEGTIQRDDMIKVIGPTGKVLVLRPDATIPIARFISKHLQSEQDIFRYFYVMDVFRQTLNGTDHHERTQAGVEYFGNSSPIADTEVLALAAHLLKDLQIDGFTLEIGHAGFAQHLLHELPLNEKEVEQLKQLIQAKNKNEIEVFLAAYDMDPTVKRLLLEIPQLYGKPEEVIERAKRLSLNEQMAQAIDNLETVCDLLTSYNLSEHLVIDLGLINHMDYYSDIIFQGFIKRVGKPVLMGGRYDKLTEQFDTTIPAIGFACDIDLIMDGLTLANEPAPVADLAIYYDAKSIKDALILANELRNRNRRVLFFQANETSRTMDETLCNISFVEGKMTMYWNETEQQFSTQESILKFIEKMDV